MEVELNSKTLIMIPVYNAAGYIQRSIESCLNQTLPTDVWIVDNRSTDKTQSIVSAYIEKYDRVKLFVNDNNYGRVGNWNRCLDLFMNSEYEYIKYVFSGDEIFPNCIEEGEKAFSFDNEIGAVAFPYEFVSEDNIVSISRHGECPNVLFSAKDITYKNLANDGLLGAIVSNIYSKKHIGNIRFNEFYSAKTDFDILVLKNSKAFYLDKVLARFNVDSHKTFLTADWSFLNMEFSYIESKELRRLERSKYFTSKEVSNISQSIMLNCIKRQLKYMKKKTIVRAIVISITELYNVKPIIKSVLPKQLYALLKSRYSNSEKYYE
jgi:glycosyltransferase involved in cell wall biosynthesis